MPDESLGEASFASCLNLILSPAARRAPAKGAPPGEYIKYEMTIIHGLNFDNLRGDIYGGLTAVVVAWRRAPVPSIHAAAGKTLKSVGLQSPL
jgi:hypothetical protein